MRIGGTSQPNGTTTAITIVQNSSLLTRLRIQVLPVGIPIIGVR